MESKQRGGANIVAALKSKPLKEYLAKSLSKNNIHLCKDEEEFVKVIDSGTTADIFLYENDKKSDMLFKALDVLQKDRSRSFTPFIVISKEKDKKKISKFFECGASDVFPFKWDFSLLALRIKKELERYFNHSYMISKNFDLRRKHDMQKRLNFFVKKIQTLKDTAILDEHIPRFLKIIFKTGLFSFYEYNEEKKSFRILSHNHKKIENGSFDRLQKVQEDSIMWEVIRRKDAVLIEDVGNSEFFKARKKGKQYTGKSVLSVPIIYDNNISGIINMTNKKDDCPFTDWDVEIARSLAEHVGSQMEIIRSYKKIEKLSMFDPLTEIFNRRQLLEEIETEFAKSIRYRQPISFIMGDIDYFKEINDRYGHIFGDFVIKKISSIIKENIREKNVDILGRYGGEEFLLCFPNIDSNSAFRAIERIRKLIQETEFYLDGVSTHVTMSFGISERLPLDTKSSQVIKRADKALYHSKDNGRNRVSLEGPTKKTMLAKTL